MLRAIAMLKMRGSVHEHEIRRYEIDGEGMHIGEPFREVRGILSGNPHVAERRRPKDGNGEGERGG